MTVHATRGVDPIASRSVLWLIPIALTLHNGEEAATIPRYLPLVRARLPDFARPIAAGMDLTSIWLALVVATIVPFLVIAWTARRPHSLTARWCALALLAVVALNAASHLVVAGILMRGYSPGLVTALVVNAPLSIVLFRRAAREQWIPTWSWWLLLPAAVLVHGPGLLGLLLLT